MSVSLILVSRNEEVFAKDFFQSLKKQTRKPDEIIMIDSSDMSDRTLGIAQQFISDMKIFFTHPFPVGAQRQFGVEESSGDILVFTDLDAVLYPDWLEKLIEKFNDDSVDIVRGSVLYKEIKDKIPHRFTKIHHCNTAYRRRVLEEFPFDGKCVHDDADMNERIGKKYKIYGAPLAKVFHIGSFSKTTTKEKAKRYALADLYLTKKHRNSYMFIRPFLNDFFCLTEFRLKFVIYHFWFYLRGLL